MTSFSLTIHTVAGETEHQRRAEVCHLLQQAIGNIGSARTPEQTLKHRDGETVGHYEFFGLNR
jgi:hypothetical protein